MAWSDLARNAWQGFNPRLSASLPPAGTTSPTSSATGMWGGSSQSPFMRRTQRASWNPMRPTLGQPPGSRPGGMLADVRTPPQAAQNGPAAAPVQSKSTADFRPASTARPPKPPATQPGQNAQPPAGGTPPVQPPPAGTLRPYDGGKLISPKEGSNLTQEQIYRMSGYEPPAPKQNAQPPAGTLGGAVNQATGGMLGGQAPGTPPSPTPTTAAGGAGNPVPGSWLDKLRQNTTGYINTTLGNQGGAYSPEVMNSMRDQIAKRMQSASLSAAGNQGTLGSSVLARNMGQEVGDALTRLEMENQSQGLAARQNAAQLGQGMFFGGTGDLMRQQELGGNLQSQNLNDYLRWQQLQNDMYWKPKEFAYNVALNDAMRQAGADAGQSALYGKLLESGMGMLGYANAPQYQYNPVATA